MSLALEDTLMSNLGNGASMLLIDQSRSRELKLTTGDINASVFMTWERQKNNFKKATSFVTARVLEQCIGLR